MPIGIIATTIRFLWLHPDPNAWSCPIRVASKDERLIHRRKERGHFFSTWHFRAVHSSPRRKQGSYSAMWHCKRVRRHSKHLKYHQVPCAGRCQLFGLNHFITLWYNAMPVRFYKCTQITEPLLKTMTRMVSWISIHHDDGCVDVDAFDVDWEFPGGIFCCCMP